MKAPSVRTSYAFFAIPIADKRPPFREWRRAPNGSTKCTGLNSRSDYRSLRPTVRTAAESSPFTASLECNSSPCGFLWKSFALKSHWRIRRSGYLPTVQVICAFAEFSEPLCTQGELDNSALNEQQTKERGRANEGLTEGAYRRDALKKRTVETHWRSSPKKSTGKALRQPEDIVPVTAYCTAWSLGSSRVIL